MALDAMPQQILFCAIPLGREFCGFRAFDRKRQAREERNARAKQTINKRDALVAMSE